MTSDQLYKFVNRVEPGRLHVCSFASMFLCSLVDFIHFLIIACLVLPFGIPLPYYCMTNDHLIIITSHHHIIITPPLLSPSSSGLIRVDADEVTYPMHIILRFELEQALFAPPDKALDVNDLPAGIFSLPIVTHPYVTHP